MNFARYASELNLELFAQFQESTTAYCEGVKFFLVIQLQDPKSLLKDQHDKYVT